MRLLSVLVWQQVNASCLKAKGFLRVIDRLPSVMASDCGRKNTSLSASVTRSQAENNFCWRGTRLGTIRILEFHLEVADLDRSLQLYSALLPHRRVIHWDDGSAAALVLADGAAFGLWQVGKAGIHAGRGGRHVHFAFQIDPHEYPKYFERIAELGLEPLEHAWPDGHQSVFFFDPDGHQGEFMTRDWSGG